MAKVKELLIKNIKNVEYVEIEAGETINFIAGNNWAGKTSVIEAIFQAIDLKKYVESWDAWKLIKKWEENGIIKLTLEHQGDTIEVVRTFDKEKWPKMTATSKTGARLNQTFLNSLLWEFTMDPLAFSRMRPQDQIDMLKEIAGINTDAIDKQIDENFEKRTSIRREERELRAYIEKHSDAFVAVERKSVQQLVDEKSKAVDHNNSIIQAKDLVRRAEGAIVDYDKELEQLEARKKAILENKALAEKTIDEQKPKTTEQMIDTTELDAQIQNIEEHNKKASAWENHQKQVEKHQKVAHEADGLDELIDDLRHQRIKMFVDAWLPIEWLGFDDDGNMLINWVAFSQLSTWEQIKISTELATHDRPELKVIYIKDGSLLDDESIETITEIAKERDYQIFVELVGEKQTKQTMITLRQWKALSDNNAE